MEMTLFQARYIQWLTLIGCSIRSTAGHFYGRYNQDYSFKGLNTYEGYGGNQLDGIFLREEAIKVLEEKGVDPMFDMSGNNIGYEHDSYRNWRKETKQKRKA